MTFINRSIKVIELVDLSKEMPKTLSIQTVPVQVVVVVGFAIIVYMLFLITTSIYKDYRVEQQLSLIEYENEVLHTENKQKTEDFLYFSSPQFKDKYAKMNLEKVNPGEKVIVFTMEEEHIFHKTIEADDQKVDLTLLPKNKQWYNYFFGS